MNNKPVVAGAKASKEIKQAVKKEVSKVEDAKSTVKKKAISRLGVVPKKLSEYIQPMLAKETDTPFDDKDWIYELKWDGYRAIAEVTRHEVSLYSRNGNSFNAVYPIVVDALRKMNMNAVLDGEIVVVEKNGKSNFQLLQYYQTDNDHNLQYYVFDLLQLNGENTCDLPLTERKQLLQQLLTDTDNSVVKYSDHIEEKGLEFFEAARKADLEGIMAKKADSLYHTGMRTSEWLKIKHHKSQEAIIAGFTAPGGSRKYFGALVLGIKKGDQLKYIGHTGTGFNASSLKDMSKLLQPLIQEESPFKERVKTNMPVTWVKPVLVCEVKYSEITNDGLMRHPVFLRLRDDKKAKDITMDTKVVKKNKVVAPLKKTSVGKTGQASAAKKVTTSTTEIKNKTSTIKKTATKKLSTKPAAVEKKVAPVATENEKQIAFGKIKVNVTNLKKVYWPDEGITKGEVIKYYISIAKYILPYLKDRPESLKRNPNGIKDSGFFHKDAGDEAPKWVKSKVIFSESTNKDIDYILCNNAATLIYLNNLGCIEINPWHSTIQALDKPDYLIIDIDPSEKNTFEQVIEAANVIRELFEKAGTESYCKTSGATGLHIYVPTQKKYTYDQLKDFSHLICMMAQEQLPKFTSLERNLQKRGNKMIYMDYLQNRRGQTISSVYSLRPKEGATVSIPLKWAEVKPGLKPSDFTIYNALKRIEKMGDIFSPVLGKGIDLNKCLKLLES